MNIDQDAFREAALSTGMGIRFEIEDSPLTESETLYGHVRMQANELISSAHHFLPTLPRVHFDFVFDGIPNAYAAKYKGEYFIGITTGAVYLTSMVLARILAHRETFLDIGLPQSELEELPQISWQTLDAETLYQSGVLPITPKDDRRRAYFQHLFAQLALFMVGHELAHITRGHVDYLESKRGSALVAELGWKGESGDALLERQVLEFDADRRAVLARAISMFNTVDSKTSKKKQPWSDSGKLISIESLQFDWAFAANVMFRLFGDSLFTKQEMENSTHPPMPLRRRMAMEYATLLLVNNWDKNKIKTIETTFGNSIRETELAFQTIGAPKQGGGFTSAYSETSEIHLGRMKELASKLAPAVQKHAYENIKPQFE